VKPHNRATCLPWGLCAYLVFLLAPAQTAVADTTTPETAAAVLSDTDGALHEIVLHYTDEYAEDLQNLYDALFDALPVDVRLRVVCPSAERALRFDQNWGNAERARGRLVSVLNVDRPITVWARDRRIARADLATGNPAPAVIPSERPDWDEPYRNELVIGPLAELGGQTDRTEDTPLIIEGGNVVANHRHAFVGANVLTDNETDTRPRAAIRRELLRILGRPFLLVGEGPGDPPYCHTDMYLTPLDDHTILVGSPSLTGILLDEDEPAPAPGNLDTDAWVGALAFQPTTFDFVARQLAHYGYRILRTPVVVSPDGAWMLTYNNVVQERRDGRHIVYMPTYGILALDQAAESLYRSLGCEVHGIDASRILGDGGALRCIMNVTHRTPKQQPDAAPVSALPAAAAATPSDDAPHAATAWPAWAAALWLPLLIFIARVADVSLGTVRLICVNRGHRNVATILAFAEISIWLASVATVLANLTNLLNVLAYASGFTVGNAVGMWLEARLALGSATLLMISRDRGHTIAARLREAGYRLTTLGGNGRDGNVDVCITVVARRNVPVVQAVARAVDPQVFISVEDVRQVNFNTPSGNPLPRPSPRFLRPRLLGRRRPPAVPVPDPPPQEDAA
jgi:uncharacterized protein YebE (UPF0316 family)